MLTHLLTLGSKILDRVLPDPDQRLAAKAELARQQAAGDLLELEMALSAILAEAQSQDPWARRARPTFLYVMYVLILWAIPISLLYAVFPSVATDLIDGMHQFWAALPEELYWLFGTGYLGYSAARSIDKRRKPLS